MALVPLSQQDDYDLANSKQDCRGWLVHDGKGNAIGRVREMIVDTEQERISHLILEDRTEIPARQVSFVNNTVVVRGYTGATATTDSTKVPTKTPPTRIEASDAARDEDEPFKEGVFEVMLMGDELVAQKQARVVEEIVVNKETIERIEMIRDTVRHTDVEVERIEGADASRRDDK